MSFGEKLRELRGSISQEKMAKELNITKSSLVAYERNKRVPRDEVKIRIAKYFGKTVQDIFLIAMSTYNAQNKIKEGTK